MSGEYIHGFSEAEQARLVRQAEVLAPNVFADLDLTGCRELLEIGCGVGAELRLLHRRWPSLQLTGLDCSRTHLDAARRLLASEMEAGAVRLVEADAERIPFADGAFDAVLTIWMLEHAKDVDAVLREALRVTRPQGRVILTEVDNDTFRFEPRSELIAEWWDLFNRYQRKGGGDPFVGRNLETRLTALGARRVLAVRFPNVSSRREPERRRVLLDYLEELLLSGAENLRSEGAVSEARVADLRREFERIRNDPRVEFEYLAYRVTCQPPEFSALGA